MIQFQSCNQNDLALYISSIAYNVYVQGMTLWGFFLLTQCMLRKRCVWGEPRDHSCCFSQLNKTVITSSLLRSGQISGHVILKFCKTNGLCFQAYLLYRTIYHRLWFFLKDKASYFKKSSVFMKSSIFCDLGIGEDKIISWSDSCLFWFFIICWSECLIMRLFVLEEEYTVSSFKSNFLFKTWSLEMFALRSWTSWTILKPSSWSFVVLEAHTCWAIKINYSTVNDYYS